MDDVTGSDAPIPGLDTQGAGDPNPGQSNPDHCHEIAPARTGPAVPCETTPHHEQQYDLWPEHRHESAPAREHYGHGHGHEYPQRKEQHEMDGIASDKVNIHVGGGEGGRGAEMAALVAALGQRNQGNDHAALIAALGNRNDSASNMAPLFALLGDRHHDGDGYGANALWPIILLALFGRRGFGGGDDCHDGGVSPGHAALLQTLLEGQSELRAQVPTSALEIQNQICQQLGALALGVQQGFANTKDAVQAGLLAELAATAGVKDAVQNGFAITNNNILEGVCSIKQTVRDDGDRTRSQIALYHEANLQRELGVAQAALAEERTSRRVRDVEVNMNQSVNQTQLQAQQQQQQQAQFDRLFGLLGSIGNQVLLSRQAQDIVNLGTMTASGTQAAANTQVR